jgi:hypothetical protein
MTRWRLAHKRGASLPAKSEVNILVKHNYNFEVVNVITILMRDGLWINGLLLCYGMGALGQE